MLQKLIDKILRREEIARSDGQSYLSRWTLLRLSNTFWLWKLLKINDIRIYIHRFNKGDCSISVHDHPCTMISFVFKNGYSEEYWDTKSKLIKTQIFKAPCIRKFSASHSHRVTLLKDKPAWTLLLAFKKTRNWGFWRTNKDGKRKWVQWEEYNGKYAKEDGCDP